MPADNVRGWRADTLERLRELDSPVYRWPGGNFVSGYDWKDGIGDPDKRPPRKNPAWKGIEHNDVGIHEFMDLCREIGTDPYIAVNTGLGGVEGAREEVEYLNGAPTTPMGKLRAQNGQSKPFGVKLFAVGNEMYGDWQLGHMSLDEYVKKHKTVVDAMRTVDRSIELVGVGALGDWSRRMLTDCSSHMAMISEHVYWQSKPSLLEHVGQARDSIRKIAEGHRAYRKEIPSLKGKNVRVALDEWNYWYGPNEYGELGTRYFLDDGLGIAVGLHEMFRQSDIYAMANYAQTVNVIGAIKTTPTEAEMETTGLVLALYRKHFGVLPLAVTGEQGDLDVAAARSADGRAITLAVVNPTEDAAKVSLGFAGAEAAGAVRRWTITGPTRRAFNAPGQPRQVTVAEETLGALGESVSVPPLSVVLYEIPVR
jgi:alpha-N-arabinofuranosidase